MILCVIVCVLCSDPHGQTNSEKSCWLWWGRPGSTSTGSFEEPTAKGKIPGKARKGNFKIYTNSRNKDIINTRTAIGHFKLTFASVSKQVLVQSLELFLFTCKWTNICMWIKLMFTWKALHWASLWNRGERQLEGANCALCIKYRCSTDVGFSILSVLAKILYFVVRVLNSFGIM